MNDFRPYRTPQRLAGGSFDGVVRTGNRPAARKPSAQVRTHNQQSTLEGFRRREGFNGLSTMQLRTSSAAAVRQDPVGEIPRQPKADLPGGPSRVATAHKPRHKKRKLATRFMSVIVFGVIVLGGVLAGKGYIAVNSVFRGGGDAPALAEDVDPATLSGEGDGRVNILMLGKGSEGHDGADLTDTILVASIDPINKKASILSIPRDLWVKNPAGGHSKINAVYAATKSKHLNADSSPEQIEEASREGISALEGTIEETMGIPIHYYTVLDFIAFQQAINTVGGVDLTISPDDAAGIVRETLWDELTGENYTLDVQPGENHFDGQRALMYARSRHASARGDFDRTERQRKIILALKDKVLSAGTYGNPVKISQLMNDFGSHMTSNLGLREVLRIYELGSAIDTATINSVGLADPPNVLVRTDMIDGQSVVRPMAGLSDYSEIQSFVRNTLKDGYLQKESADIAVYNGTNINGLAGQRADDLRSYGYGITTVANAPGGGDYGSTILVDLTAGEKKYTRHYLENRLGVTAVDSLPDGVTETSGADFVIILGQNEANR
ncbi:hypothetical protein CR970_01230 [Candidatus Saccharibacteria bacterium]|nr:MAG: hypothetical protein CR970_01230 [Candidatus Saccharibacteria bacterium]